MAQGHIAVGFDGSASSRPALNWALQEAVRRHAVVTVVTVCPPPHGADRHEPVPTAVVAAYQTQRRGIAAARAVVSGADALVVGGEVVLGDAASALGRATAAADLLVLGSDETVGLCTSSVPGQLARLMAERRGHGRRGHGRHCPLVVIATPGETPAPRPDRSHQPADPAESTMVGAADGWPLVTVR